MRIHRNSCAAMLMLASLAFCETSFAQHPNCVPSGEGKVVVAYSKVCAPSRPISTEELQVLENTLAWHPNKARIVVGQQVQAELRDPHGNTLAVIRLTWDRRENNEADFTVRLDNRSSCNFNSSAVIKATQAVGNVVAEYQWFGWTNLKEPGPGAASTVRGSAPIAMNAGDSLEFVPIYSQSTLGHCHVSDNGRKPPTQVVAANRLVQSAPVVAPREDSECAANRSFAQSNAETSPGQISLMQQLGSQWADMQRLNAEMWDAISRASCADLAAADSTLNSLRSVDTSPEGYARAEANIRALPPSIRDHVMRQFQAMRTAMNQ